eukprot:7388079-Pyramimonas_sp.AAC.1
MRSVCALRPRGGVAELLKHILLYVSHQDAQHDNKEIRTERAPLCDSRPLAVHSALAVCVFNFEGSPVVDCADHVDIGVWDSKAGQRDQ